MEPRRFVILRHEPGVAGPRQLHWDLMLEFGDRLRTWALDSEPCLDNEISANELPSHRLDYLGYEGAVSGGRGTVRRFDRGTFEVVEVRPGRVSVDLAGESLQGRLELTYNSIDQRWKFLLRSS
ncbi:MAG: DNA polymerase ligase N-terminal domain-containing protein [Pirellulaceae bacterium]